MPWEPSQDSNQNRIVILSITTPNQSISCRARSDEKWGRKRNYGSFDRFKDWFGSFHLAGFTKFPDQMDRCPQRLRMCFKKPIKPAFQISCTILFVQCYCFLPRPLYSCSTRLKLTMLSTNNVWPQPNGNKAVKFRGSVGLKRASHKIVLFIDDRNVLSRVWTIGITWSHDSSVVVWKPGLKQQCFALCKYLIILRLDLAQGQVYFQK